MSFFIKSKPKRGIKNKFSNKKEHIGNAKKAKTDSNNDDTITSSEDEEEEHNDDMDHVNGGMNVPPSDDENETAQEKKLRLAKIFLEEIEKEEAARLNEDEELHGDAISKRLKLDYLKQAGKLKLSVANEYVGADINNIQILKAKEHKNAVTCLCVSSDNKFVFSGSKDSSIVKWSLVENRKVKSIPFQKKLNKNSEVVGHSKQILCIAISFDDKFLAVGDATSVIQIWNPEDLKHIGSLKGHRDSVTGLTFRGNTHSLYSCSNDRSVKVWSLDEMSYVETLYGHQDKITSIDCLIKERAITAGGRDASIRLWKILEESQLIYNGHSGSIDVVRLINEEHFASGGDDGNLCIWSTGKKKPVCIVKEAHGCDPSNLQPFWITSIAVLVNTDLIASGSNDGSVRLWHLENKPRQLTLLFPIQITGFVNDLAFIANGDYLAAAIGIEHRFGRWSVIKSAKNSIAVIPLTKKNST
ncbi:hypothetical protein RI129_012131 [Pyrocoelia pectoralis]|uniref:U3 small nucleolar RNA-interacting protein 2 n=1 Tax=Pyrocoelia pectoralis TaxID=417401 RepID=A0AAN7V440_9COLE